MNNKETAEHIRKIINGQGPFGWVTDGCGYEQHIKFVKHRNDNWNESIPWHDFVLNYADMLEEELNHANL